MVFKEVTQAIQGRQTVNPRTVLGFYATIVALLLTASVGASAVLASTKTATWLIPWVLVFIGILIVALIIGVFVINYRDPSKLMLGQITGSEYAVINSAILGDSQAGERLQLLLPQLIPGDVITAEVDQGSEQAPSAADADATLAEEEDAS